MRQFTVVALLFTAACIVPDDALEGRPCRCIEGWVCQDSICVRERDALDGGMEDQGITEADQGSPDMFEVDDLGQDMPFDMGPPGPVFAITCESSTATLVPDATGNGFDGVCRGGGCPPLAADGAIGSACDFTSTVHLEIDIPTGSRLDVPAAGASFSLAYWFQKDDLAFSSSFSRPYGAGTANSWEFYFSNTDDGTRPTFWRVTAADRDDLTTPTVSAVGEWHHLAVVVDGIADETTLYLDGSAQAMAAGATFLYDDHPILIGADENGGVRDNHFRGLLDELYFYDRVISEAEITELATRP